jgi:hypothetical protein
VAEVKIATTYVPRPNGRFTGAELSSVAARARVDHHKR